MSFYKTLDAIDADYHRAWDFERLWRRLRNHLLHAAMGIHVHDQDRALALLSRAKRADGRMWGANRRGKELLRRRSDLVEAHAVRMKERS